MNSSSQTGLFIWAQQTLLKMGKSVHLLTVIILCVAFYLNEGCSKITVFNQEFDDKFINKPQEVCERLNSSKSHSNDVLKIVAVSVLVKENDANLYDKVLAPPSKHSFNKIRMERSDKKNTQLFERACVQMDKRHTVKNSEFQRTYFREKKVKQKTHLYYENKVPLKRKEIETRINNQRRPMSFNIKKRCLEEGRINSKISDKRQRQQRHETANRIRRQKKRILSSTDMFDKYSFTRTNTQIRRMNERGSYVNHVKLNILSENRNANTRNTTQRHSYPYNTYRNFRKSHHKMVLNRRDRISTTGPQLRSVRNIERQESPRRNDARRKYDTIVRWPQESRFFGEKIKHRQESDVVKVTEERRKYTNQRKNRDINSVKNYDCMHTRLHKRQTNHLLETRKSNFRGIVSDEATNIGYYRHWDEGEFSKATIVCFVGIIGRKLWKK